MNRKSLALLMLVILVSVAFTVLAAVAQVPSMSDIGKTATSASPINPSSLLNINSASKEQLASLPGIGDEFSQKIIAGRPYSKKTDLVTKKILSQSSFDKIKDLINVGPK